ncbi:copper amine oxidase N-terminal domain-containing protein [Paenibacillus sp. strain BS8-2]
MKKQRITILMAALIVLIGLVPVHASAAGTSGAPSPKTVQVESQPIRLVFDDKELSLPKGLYAFLYQDRTYIPIRYLSYALLKQVGWDGDKFEVTISEPNQAELAELKKQLLSASGGKTSTVKQKLTMIFREATLVFDGKTKALPKGQSLFIHEGSMYVPLRFLAESIGTKIDWDPDTRTVRGQSKAYLASQGGGKDEPDEETGGAGGNSSGSGNGTVGGGTGGGLPGKASYEQITSNAEARLYALKSSCQSTLLDTAVKYVDADEADKAALYAELQAELAACMTDFEKVLNETSAALTAGGYSTDIIAEYRAEFEAELEAGRKLAESL